MNVAPPGLDLSSGYSLARVAYPLLTRQLPQAANRHPAGVMGKRVELLRTHRRVSIA